MDIIDGLKSDNGYTRGAAVVQLTQNGSRFVPQVVEVLRQDSNPDVRASAATALGEISDVTALAALLVALNDTDWLVRKNAACAIWLNVDPSVQGKSAAWSSAVSTNAEAVAILKRALDDKDKDVRRYAQQTLACFQGN